MALTDEENNGGRLGKLKLQPDIQHYRQNKNEVGGFGGGQGWLDLSDKAT